MKPNDLKAWRDRLGWTQAVAADCLGVTPQHYRKLESGRVPLARVYELACAELSRKNKSPV
jgi:transcriptional regulator with XRE-family HTH domain